VSELPASSPRHPSTRLLTSLRPAAQRIIRSRWPVRVHGAEGVPEAGPVILASNHVGLIDGPLLAIFAPRPVHALTKEEMFSGRLGRFLDAAGQIPLHRFGPDPAAIKSCVRVLRDGGVVGIFPEGTRGDGELHRFHHGAGYLALVTGAPVVSVTMLGTRASGAGSSSLPPKGGEIDVVFGTAWQTRPVPWPRTREHVRATSALLREHMLSDLARALELTGRSLPGPLPAGQREYDPPTGFVDQGAR